MKIIFATLAVTAALAGSSAFAQSALDIERSGMEPDRVPTTPSTSALRGQQRGVALSTGLLLIPESTNDRVMAFDPQTGNLVDPDFIPADPTNLSTPIHAILSSNGQSILVSDQLDDVVQQYDLDGNYLGVFAPAGGADTSILDNIRGISLDSANGNLLVSVGGGANDDAIAEFDSTGNYLGNRVANGAGGLDSPFDVFEDGSGFLVSGINSDAIHAYLTGGSSAGVFAAVDTFPEQIQIISGSVLVGNFSGTQEGVIEFDLNGAVIGVYDPPVLGGYRGVYELPNGNILTTNGSGVHEIDRSGNLIETKVSGVSARFIERIQINGPPTAPVITNPPPGASILIQGLPGDELIPAWTASTDPESDPVTYTWELGSDALFSTVLLSIPTGTGTDVTLTLEAVDLLLSSNGVNVGDTITLFHRATASDGTSSVPGPAAEVTFTRGIVAVPALPVPLFSPVSLALLILLILAAVILGARGKARAAPARN